MEAPRKKLFGSSHQFVCAWPQNMQKQDQYLGAIFRTVTLHVLCVFLRQSHFAGFFVKQARDHESFASNNIRIFNNYTISSSRL